MKYILIEVAFCTGDKNAGHSWIVMKPHDEDHTKLKLDCVCVPKRLIKQRRDCPTCCQKCPMCFIMRKDVLSFEYMPLASIITNMCLSQTLCHDFLALWRNRNAWRGLRKDFVPDTIKEFWDGEKFTLYQSFWDPLTYWEVPIVCTNDSWKRTFRAFPEALKCEELKHGSMGACGLYSFPCPKYATLVEAPRRVQRVSLCSN
jgi:hypothetical protein